MLRMLPSNETQILVQESMVKVAVLGSGTCVLSSYQQPGWQSQGGLAQGDPRVGNAHSWFKRGLSLGQIL